MFCAQVRMRTSLPTIETASLRANHRSNTVLARVRVAIRESRTEVLLVTASDRTYIFELHQCLIMIKTTIKNEIENANGCK